MERARHCIKQYFGYDSFREGQETLISAILTGSDALGVMPTGAGKSLCYQVPALILEGLTVIVSPLISLMKDQVNALEQTGISAAFINSSLTDEEMRAVLQKAHDGEYCLLYAAPERLLTAGFIYLAKSVRISMLTVDEAHCISQWGQDFRPSYARIPEFIAQLPTRPIVSAFTATATAQVREDIIRLLDLQHPVVLVTGFDRHNLYFDIQTTKDKFAALAAFLHNKRKQSGIVYCSTRAAVDEVCEKLKNLHYNAAKYHAGLSDEERKTAQDDFLYDRVQIMAATNAFGMGIDKSNVSFVVHYNMPKDIESYYQEAGRAGRDGQNAECLVLYSPQDVRTQQWLIENARENNYPDEETEERIKEFARKRLRDMTFYCTTVDCFRSFMLKYFGEAPPASCGNCGNCGRNFTTTDVTVDAQKILSCVYRVQERFGAQMIIDILRGSKNERVLKFSLDKLSTYNICEKTAPQLRSIIDHLLIHNYLIKTDDEYPVIKLGKRAGEVLRGTLAVTMKQQTDEHNLSDTKKTKLTKEIPNHTKTNSKLFSALRVLRAKIAAEQQVPAFVVFSDSTLTDMCIKIPKSSTEMLAVSGVGEIKLERYGAQFLRTIAEFSA